MLSKIRGGSVSVFIGLFALTCAGSASGFAGTPPITLDYIESLKIGSTTKPEIEAKLGKPYWVSDDKKSLELLFLNPQGTGQRASFSFNEKGILETKMLLITDADSEIQPEVAFKRYPHSKFHRHDAEITDPHSLPDEVYYEDLSTGLSIEIRKGRNEVSTLSWADPKLRKVAKSAGSSSTAGH